MTTKKIPYASLMHYCGRCGKRVKPYFGYLHPNADVKSRAPECPYCGKKLY